MPPDDPIRSAPCRNRAWFPVFRRRRGWVMLLGLLCLGGHPALRADPEVSKEYQIKAAFLYNFTKFVEWPPGRFADPASPLVIAVLGENPLGDELARLVQGRKVNGRELAVRSLAAIAEAGSVHLLFVTAQEEDQLGPALDRLRASGVLTVGESARFAAAGGIITFTREGDKVRFEINIAAAERSGLKVSAQLQKLATAVRRQP